RCPPGQERCVTTSNTVGVLDDPPQETPETRRAGQTALLVRALTLSACDGRRLMVRLIRVVCGVAACSCLILKPALALQGHHTVPTPATAPAAHARPAPSAAH